MDIELVVIEGSGAGRTFPVRAGNSRTFGRGPDCDIDLQEQGVSRRHCTVENSGFTVTVTDLESVNGTFVNGKPVVRRAVLEAGDELAVGPVVLTCRALLLPLPGPGAQEEIHEGPARLVLRDEESSSLIRKVVDTAHPSLEPASVTPEALQ